MRDSTKGCPKEVIKRSVTFPKWKLPPDLWAIAVESVVWEKEWVVRRWVHAPLSLQTAQIYIFLMDAVSTDCCKSRERGFNL